MSQLELFPSRERAGSFLREECSYLTTQIALVEEFDTRRYIYGQWRHFFGCWVIDKNTGQCQSFVPSWPVLGNSLLTAEGLRDKSLSQGILQIPTSSDWRYEANAAFIAFFSAIPSWVCGIISSLGRYQWPALDMIWQVPEFASFLDDEIYAGHVQFIFACFSLDSIEQLSRKERNDLAHEMMTWKRHELLSELAGAPCTQRTVKVFYKLGELPHEKKIYLELIEAMLRPEAEKVFLHAAFISPFMAQAAHFLPLEAVHTNVLNFLAEDMNPGRLSIIRDIFDILPEGKKPDAAKSLECVKTQFSFKRWVEKWEKWILFNNPFPPPPIPGDEIIQPIVSPKMLLSEARAMKNCLMSFVESVRDGEIYFYHAQGLEPATVALRYEGGGEWSFYEAWGPNNKDLGCFTQGYIQAVVAEQIDEVSHTYSTLVEGQDKEGSAPGSEESTGAFKVPLLNVSIAALWLLMFTPLGQAYARKIDVPPHVVDIVETYPQAPHRENTQVAGVFNKLIEAFIKSGRKAPKNADDVMEGTETLSRGADDAASTTSHPERKAGGEKAGEEDGALEEFYFYLRSACNRREREDDATKCRDLFKDEDNHVGNSAGETEE